MAGAGGDDKEVDNGRNTRHVENNNVLRPHFVSAPCRERGVHEAATVEIVVTWHRDGLVVPRRVGRNFVVCSLLRQVRFRQIF